MLWGNTNYANAAPKTAQSGRHGSGDAVNYGANVASSHGNTVFAVPAANKASTKATHAGWVVVKKGSGYVANLTITTPGTGYSNTNYWRANTGTVEANGTITTDGSGVITAVAVVNKGAGFTAVPTVAIVNSTGGTTGIGTSGVLTAIAGGRVGRVYAETLVAGGSYVANGGGSEFTNLV